MIGMPDAYSRFVEDIRRNGQTAVEILLQENSSRESGHLANCVSVSIRSGTIELGLKEYVHSGSGGLYGTVITKLEPRRDALRYALEMAERLERDGLKLSIRAGGAVTTEDVRKLATKYSEMIAGLKHDSADFPTTL